MPTPLELAEYVARPVANADFLAPPPVCAPWPAQPWWSWQAHARRRRPTGRMAPARRRLPASPAYPISILVNFAFSVGSAPSLPPHAAATLPQPIMSRPYAPSAPIMSPVCMRFMMAT